MTDLDALPWCWVRSQFSHWGRDVLGVHVRGLVVVLAATS